MNTCLRKMVYNKATLLLMGLLLAGARPSKTLASYLTQAPDELLQSIFAFATVDDLANLEESGHFAAVIPASLQERHDWIRINGRLCELASLKSGPCSQFLHQLTLENLSAVIRLIVIKSSHDLAETASFTIRQRHNLAHLFADTALVSLAWSAMHNAAIEAGLKINPLINPPRHHGHLDQVPTPLVKALQDEFENAQWQRAWKSLNTYTGLTAGIGPLNRAWNDSRNVAWKDFYQQIFACGRDSGLVAARMAAWAQRDQNEIGALVFKATEHAVLVQLTMHAQDIWQAAYAAADAALPTGELAEEEGEASTVAWPSELVNNAKVSWLLRSLPKEKPSQSWH